MGLNTRGETEQVRKPKQTHTKTTTKHNHQNPQQAAQSMRGGRKMRVCQIIKTTIMKPLVQRRSAR